MATMPLHPAAQAAREAHRDPRGRFGVQPAAESELCLSPSREQVHSRAVTALRAFDPGRTGTAGGTVIDAVQTHRTLTVGTSWSATDKDRARALTECLRAERDGVGGLSREDTQAVLEGTLHGSVDHAHHLASTHRGAAEHLLAVRSGIAEIGDHPQDRQTLRAYRSHLGIRPAAPTDAEGTIEELSLAWSYRLDRDAMEAVRAARHTSTA